MNFNKVIGVKNIDRESKIKYREAVRGIITYHNKVLMVHSKLGYYKLPGGGVKNDESHKDALMREVQEETGFLSRVIGEKVGLVTERYIDRYDSMTIFQMNSHYYLCELTGGKAEQRLDDYEAREGFMPVWVTVEDAIKQNELVFKKHRFLNRENTVLRELRNMKEVISVENSELRRRRG